jgi:hypothetical protein
MLTLMAWVCPYQPYPEESPRSPWPIVGLSSNLHLGVHIMSIPTFERFLLIDSNSKILDSYIGESLEQAESILNERGWLIGTVLSESDYVKHHIPLILDKMCHGEIRLCAV